MAKCLEVKIQNFIGSYSPLESHLHSSATLKNTTVLLLLLLFYHQTHVCDSLFWPLVCPIVHIEVTRRLDFVFIVLPVYGNWSMRRLNNLVLRLSYMRR